MNWKSPEIWKNFGAYAVSCLFLCILTYCLGRAEHNCFSVCVWTEFNYARDLVYVNTCWHHKLTFPHISYVYKDFCVYKAASWLCSLLTLVHTVWSHNEIRISVLSAFCSAGKHPWSYKTDGKISLWLGHYEKYL